MEKIDEINLLLSEVMIEIYEREGLKGPLLEIKKLITQAMISSSIIDNRRRLLRINMLLARVLTAKLNPDERNYLLRIDYEIPEALGQLEKEIIEKNKENTQPAIGAEETIVQENPSKHLIEAAGAQEKVLDIVDEKPSMNLKRPSKDLVQEASVQNKYTDFQMELEAIENEHVILPENPKVRINRGPVTGRSMNEVYYPPITFFQGRARSGSLEDENEDA